MSLLGLDCSKVGMQRKKLPNLMGAIQPVNAMTDPDALRQS